MDLERTIAVLSDPRVYPGWPQSVELRQTHASCVFLTETDVYKLKKPVALGFLDYSTPRRRALMCRREVVLNRRLAPSVYLGVERLVEVPGGYQVSSKGRALDYLVHMRRLPDEAMLAARLSAGLVSPREISAVARKLASFHATAIPAPPPYGSLAMLARNSRENIARVASCEAELLPGAAANVRAHTDEFLQRGRCFIEDRIAAGCIRDGHGDLRCEHVYFEGGDVLVIDCIEFNRRFRYGDVALDLAFLVMDLEVSGYPDLAEVLAGEYQAESGEVPLRLMDFYCAYRAMVRAKVAHVRSLEPEFSAEERERAQLEAMSYLHFASRFAAGRRRPLLVVVGGLTGSGKSTVAGLAASLLHAPVFNADETRKRLAGMGPGEHAGRAIDEGLYAPEMNRRVYGALFERAREQLARGRPAILDATFRRKADRAAAHALAREYGAKFLAVECTAPEATIRERLDRRQAVAPDPWSDGTWGVYISQRESFEAFDELDAGLRLVVDTTRDRLSIARAILERAAVGQ